MSSCSGTSTPSNCNIHKPRRARRQARSAVQTLAASLCTYSTAPTWWLIEGVTLLMTCLSAANAAAAATAVARSCFGDAPREFRFCQLLLLIHGRRGSNPPLSNVNCAYGQLFSVISYSAKIPHQICTDALRNETCECRMCRVSARCQALAGPINERTDW